MADGCQKFRLCVHMVWRMQSKKSVQVSANEHGLQEYARIENKMAMAHGIVKKGSLAYFQRGNGIKGNNANGFCADLVRFQRGAQFFCLTL